MQRRKLKSFVVPTIYTLIIALSFFSVALLNSMLMKSGDDRNYAKSLMKDVTEAVLKPVEENTITISKPYDGGNVIVSTYYYNKDDDEERQSKSLINYQKTYMPSTGTVYASDEEFEVLSVMPGEIKNISTDDILGTVIEVSHNANLTTFYYSVTDVALNVGDKVSTGTILGHATKNKIKDDQNNILFEVYYQGKSLDPEKFYTMQVNELQ